jgi:DNA-binding GntR family transcriptional regulator
MRARGKLHTKVSMPLGAESLTDKVFDRLLEAIEKGELPLGSRIREAVLARQFAISRGPLREALRRLEGRKLVKHTPNLGVRICSLSHDDIRQIFQIREALEGMACRLATEAMSMEEIDGLYALLEQHRAQTELKRGRSYYQRAGDLDIHYRIAQGSRNPRLVELLCDELYYFVRIHRYRSSERSGRAARAFDEHRAILDAMRARDADRAETLMRTHIRRATENLRQEVESGGLADPADAAVA